MFSTRYSSPIGELILVGDADRLTELLLPEDHGRPPAISADWVEAREPFMTAIAHLDAYFAGELRAFDLPLDLHGTSLEKAVWRVLLEIPYGETASYGEQAAKIDPTLFDPAVEPWQRARVVGAANGRNPIAIVVPCHRVIGADGSLTGYGGGLERKRTLLDLERGVRPLA